MSPGAAPGVLPSEIDVVNVGLSLFADAVRSQGRPVDQIDWRIPANGDPHLLAALTRTLGPRAADIDAANSEVFRRLDTGVPLWTAVATAGDVLPDIAGRVLLHCGPAIEWPAVCDPLRRSMRAATVAEGWAADVPEADMLLKSGAIRLEPANLHATVVPMATAIGPSMPVLVVENAAGGTRAFSALNQGSGDVAWFGRQTGPAIERLRFLRDVAGPLLATAVAESGPVDVLGLAAQGLAMGDDVHMRTQASTNLLIRHLLPQLVAARGAGAVAFARFLSGDHLFFLNLAMAAAKSLTMWAEQVPGSSIVTTMARNGTTFGVRLAGSPTWFLADAPEIRDALYNPGFGPGSGARDIGDSAVLELVGLGGAAAAGSPAVAAFLGGGMADAVEVTEDMTDICHGASSRLKLPTLDMRGTPVGVDVRLVAKLGLTPKVNTGILHVSDGSGQVGAGVATAPLRCFAEAALDLARRVA
ncbi:MAG TPA: DUF1116 domain-containing protein [Actinomycetales bacterium]|nr:DUF1116 domain-containing protein [Actinomycetales bacterium]